ncbi:MAG: site-specific tyrosine recombinase/integron integrase [Bdellovibrionota bacterium]
MKDTSKYLIDAISAFVESMRIDHGASDRTVESYRGDLLQFVVQFAAQFAADKPVDINDIGQKDIEDFLKRLHEQQQKPSTISRKISTLRQFFKFCSLEYNLEKNPAEKLPAPAQSKKLPRHLSSTEVESLLKAAETGLPYPSHARHALRARDRAMVFLLYATGLRVSELVGLCLKDVDITAGYLRASGKGRKERIVPFVQVAGLHIFEYIKSHRMALNPLTDHIFVSNKGCALTRQSFWKILKILAKQASIHQNVSPHLIRHSFATHLLQKGINIRSLQMLLGHSNLTTTEIYAHVTPEHLKETHRRCHPRGGS